MKSVAGFLRVVNWDRFQTYKDRAPAWVKLYHTLLDDWDFLALEEATQSHLMRIWLLAARTDNRIPADPAFIRQRIGASSEINLELLVRDGWLEAADGKDETRERILTDLRTHPCTDIRTKDGDGRSRDLTRVRALEERRGDRGDERISERSSLISREAGGMR